METDEKTNAKNQIENRFFERSFVLLSTFWIKTLFHRNTNDRSYLPVGLIPITKWRSKNTITNYFNYYEWNITASSIFFKDILISTLFRWNMVLKWIRSKMIHRCIIIKIFWIYDHVVMFVYKHAFPYPSISSDFETAKCRQNLKQW